MAEPDISIQDIHQKIKKRREELKMSQSELANKLGYESRSSINKIEKGINDIPRAKVKDFAKALDMPVEHLMGFEELAEKIDQRICILNSVLKDMQEIIADKDAQIDSLELELAELSEGFSFKRKMAKCIDRILSKTEWNEWDVTMLIKMMNYFSKEERISYTPECLLPNERSAGK